MKTERGERVFIGTIRTTNSGGTAFIRTRTYVAKSQNAAAQSVDRYKQGVS